MLIVNVIPSKIVRDWRHCACPNHVHTCKISGELSFRHLILELLFWFFLHQWILWPASMVVSPFKDCHLFASFQFCLFCFFLFLSAAIFSNKSFCCFFSMQHVLSFMLFLREDVSSFVYTASMSECLEIKNRLQLCDQWRLFIHSSSPEILSQNSLFYTYNLFYTFIHKHLKILKCSHRTASQKLFWSKRRAAESESSSLHYCYGWKNSSHWVPLQQDITILLGGWNKSDENTRFTKPPCFHSVKGKTGADIIL